MNPVEKAARGIDAWQQRHSVVGFPIAVVQYILFEGGKGYTLTFSTLPDELSRHTAAFERSARSFTIG